MEYYTWNTTEAMATNTDTMNDFIDNKIRVYWTEDGNLVIGA